MKGQKEGRLQAETGPESDCDLGAWVVAAAAAAAGAPTATEGARGAGKGLPEVILMAAYDFTGRGGTLGKKYLGPIGKLGRWLSEFLDWLDMTKVKQGEREQQLTRRGSDFVE